MANELAIFFYVEMGWDVSVGGTSWSWGHSYFNSRSWKEMYKLNERIKDKKQSLFSFRVIVHAKHEFEVYKGCFQLVSDIASGISRVQIFMKPWNLSVYSCCVVVLYFDNLSYQMTTRNWRGQQASYGAKWCKINQLVEV